MSTPTDSTKDISSKSILEELKFIKRQRGYYRSKATRICNNVSENVSSFSPQEVLRFKDDLTSIKEKLNALNNDVSQVMRKLKIDDAALEEELASCDE